MSKYTENKEKIREQAINWQFKNSLESKSYGELLQDFEYFSRQGKKYGLLKEFRENGII